MQFDLFENENLLNLRNEIEKVRKSGESVRRGLFARHCGLEKYMTEILEKCECLEREVYRLKQKLANQENECQIEEIKKFG